MASSILGAVASIGGSLISGAIGSHSQKQAARIQAGSAEQAAALQAEATQKGIDETKREFDIARQDVQPWRAVGQQALNELFADRNKLTRRFTPSDMYTDPGYGFRVQEGTRALNRLLARKGWRFSGPAMREATRFGQQLGTQEYGAARNRYRQWQADRWNRMAGLAGTGQTAAATQAGQATQQAWRVSNLLAAGGAARARGVLGAGTATARGLIGGAQSINNAIQGGISNYLLYSLMRGHGGGGVS